MEGPSYSSCKKELVRGLKIILPDGEHGIFLKARKEMCEVLNERGMLTCVSLPGVIKATYGVTKGKKK